MSSDSNDPLQNLHHTLKCNNAHYHCNQSSSSSYRGSLIDRGANGGILGDDAIVHRSPYPAREVDVTGIDQHTMPTMKLVDATAKVQSQRGPIIIFLHNYAYYGKYKTIHSAAQIDHYNNKVDDRSARVGGKQCITTNDGYVIPLDIVQGLPYMKMEPHTDDEFKTLPHVVLTSPGVWNPEVVDNIISDKENWFDTIQAVDQGRLNSAFDEYGNFRNRHIPETARQTPDQPHYEQLPDDELDLEREINLALTTE